MKIRVFVVNGSVGGCFAYGALASPHSVLDGVGVIDTCCCCCLLRLNFLIFILVLSLSVYQYNQRMVSYHVTKEVDGQRRIRFRNMIVSFIPDGAFL